MGQSAYFQQEMPVFQNRYLTMPNRDTVKIQSRDMRVHET